MTHQETLPMPLDSLGAGPSGLNDYRIGNGREIAAILKQFQDGNLPLSLVGSDGASLTSTLWAIDAARGLLSFSADAALPATNQLVEGGEGIAVGYLDSIKVQFDLLGLVLVRGTSGCAIGARFPRELFRFQRRNSFRVRPLLRNAPVARLHHPAIAEMQLALRVIDISIGGCALFLPDDVPAMQIGMVARSVQIDLDADIRLHADLRLQHVSPPNEAARGLRIGCEFTAIGAEAQRALQRYIDQTQKRRRLMALD